MSLLVTFSNAAVKFGESPQGDLIEKESQEGTGSEDYRSESDETNKWEVVKVLGLYHIPPRS